METTLPMVINYKYFQIQCTYNICMFVYCCRREKNKTNYKNDNKNVKPIWECLLVLSLSLHP